MLFQDHRSPACFLVALVLWAFGPGGGMVALARQDPQPPAPRVVLPDIDVPTKGMTMKQVELRYGKPVRIIPAVGDPPITRWIYDRFTVYFERQLVLHSVVPRALRIRSPETASPAKDIDMQGDEPLPSPFE